MTLIQWVIESLAWWEKKIFNELHLACPLQELLWKRKTIFVCCILMTEHIEKSTMTMNYSPYPKFQSRFLKITFLHIELNFICKKVLISANFQKCICYVKWDKAITEKQLKCDRNLVIAFVVSLACSIWLQWLWWRSPKEFWAFNSEILKTC